jgi:nucleoside-diphosphate-sugar epimerase
MLSLNQLPKIPEWRVKLSRSSLFSLLRFLFRKPSIKKYHTHFRFNKTVFSISKAKRILNYRPFVRFNEGILITGKWLKNNSYLD